LTAGALDLHSGTVSLAVHSVAERPELADYLFGMDTSWPPFMLEDPTARLMSLLPTICLARQWHPR